MPESFGTNDRKRYIFGLKLQSVKRNFISGKDNLHVYSTLIVYFSPLD